MYVGGGFSLDQETRRAANTSIHGGAMVSVNGAADGDAGCVAVWADETMLFRGNISAEGGDKGGNGGFVEVGVR